MSTCVRWTLTPVRAIPKEYPKIERRDHFWLEAIRFMKNLDERNNDKPNEKP